MLDLVQLKPEENGYAWWAVIQQTGFFAITPDKFCHVAYPLIPWLGIMLTGYGIGFLYDVNFNALKRKTILRYSGLIAIILFIVLRLTNWYGDSSHWAIQKNSLFTLMSFVNVTKYPVSLLYTLMTLGPVLIILPWMESLKKGSLEPGRIIGRVPLFYYILHFYLIHFTGLCAYMISTGTSWSALDFHFNKGFGGLPPGAGFSLVWVYVAWLSIVVTLYPLCRWYHKYKSTHNHWWLGYI